MVNQKTSNLTKHRHALEKIVLFGTILVLLIIIFISGLASAGLFSAFILFILFISLIKNQSTMKKYKQSATKITASNHPDLWNLFTECKKIIHVHEKTNMYLLDSDILNAYAIGFFRPNHIILTTAIVNHFTENEIKSIIGHELGHIHFKHTRMALLTGVFEGQNFGVFGLRFVIRFIFLYYSRLCEYSADRTGLLACKNLQDAISAELKLNMGGQAPDEKTLSRYLNANSSPNDSMLENIFELTKTHPTMKGRIQALLSYSKSQMYLNHTK